MVIHPIPERKIFCTQKEENESEREKTESPFFLLLDILTTYSKPVYNQDLTRSKSKIKA